MEPDYIAKQFGIASDLGPPPILVGPGANTEWCVNCKKAMHLSEIRKHWSGLCYAIDSICRDCQTLFPTHALVICIRCREVVARMAPERMASGFEIEPLKCYHITSCPKCNEGVEHTPILEGEYYFRTMGHQGPVRETFSGKLK